MDEEIFKQEKEKLKDIVKKINKEENNLEQYLSSADMNYDLENIAQAQFVSSQLRKLENIKSIKDKPYFARMDFKEDGKSVEKLYIGKISLLDNKTAYPIQSTRLSRLCLLFSRTSLRPTIIRATFSAETSTPSNTDHTLPMFSKLLRISPYSSSLSPPISS